MKEFMLYILAHVIQKKSRKTKIGCCKIINVHAVKTFSLGLSYLWLEGGSRNIGLLFLIKDTIKYKLTQVN